jgi:hypothetical protein
MLVLVVEQKPDVSTRILTSGESRLLHGNLDAIFSWWVTRHPAIDFREVLIDRVFSEEWKDAGFQEQRHAGKGDIRRALPESGDFDGWFIGLRSEESGWRKYWNERRNTGSRHAIYRYESGRTKGAYRCCPLAGWSENDVGAVIATNEIPLPPAYDAGLHARTTMRLTNPATSFGALSDLRDRDPDAYRRIIHRFPELGRYA